MSDGQVVFEIVGDNKPIQESLKETTRAIDSESKNWDKMVDDSTANMTSAFDKALDIKRIKDWGIEMAKELARFGIECIETASDLEEVQNVVDVTFGAEGSKKIEKWATEAGKNFGLTELQAKRYSSTLGAMMKTNGIADDDLYDISTNLAGLAADMASFYNMPFDEAFSKIQSGMYGIAQPLRQVGIDMTETAVAAYAAAEGFETEYSKMSEAEQIMVRYQYLMNQTSLAQGDFARTSDSYANSQRRVATGFETLKAQLGEALLPIASAVSDAVADLLEILTYKPPETAFDVAEDAMSSAAGQATQAQGILGYMDQLMEKYGSAAENTEEWAMALDHLKEVFPDVNQFIDEETGKLTKSNAELKAYVENSKQAAIEDAKRAALGELSGQYVQAGQQYYTAEINRDMARSQAEQARQDIINYIASHAGNEGFTGDGMSMDQLKYAAEAVANEFGESQSTISEWVRIYNEQTTAAQNFQTEMENTKSKMESLEADLDIATAALDRMAAAAQNAAGALGSAGSTGMNSGQYYNWFYGGGFASGLDYVPTEGFYHLHPGERVQTAAEASFARQYGSQQPGLDYGTLGGVMRDNIRPGGDVYLDGRTVGKVVSDLQGNQYRSLQRSGFQQ